MRSIKKRHLPCLAGVPGITTHLPIAPKEELQGLSWEKAEVIYNTKSQGTTSMMLMLSAQELTRMAGPLHQPEEAALHPAEAIQG